MNCKETERHIQQYLNGVLDEKNTKAYLKHIKQCKSCYEEMEISYMATIGLERLESGASIDIAEEMKKLIGQTERKLKQRTMLKVSGLVSYVLAMVVVVFTLSLQIIMWLTNEVPNIRY